MRRPHSPRSRTEVRCRNVSWAQVRIVTPAGVPDGERPVRFTQGAPRTQRHLAQQTQSVQPRVRAQFPPGGRDALGKYDESALLLQGQAQRNILGPVKSLVETADSVECPPTAEEKATS